MADTDDERFVPIYDEFYRMGMEARRLKNYNTVNGTAYLIDSNLDDYHNASVNMNLRLHRSQNGTDIFKFQLSLVLPCINFSCTFYLKLVSPL